MATKLRTLLQQRHTTFETHDVSAAFLRVARAYWGDRVPLELARYTQGVLVVRCPSPLWRAELLGVLQSLECDLSRELPQASIQRISPVLS